METEAISISGQREHLLTEELAKDVAVLSAWVFVSLGTINLSLSGQPRPAAPTVAINAPREPDRRSCEQQWQQHLEYRPRTPLGRKILELRARRAASGEKFLTLEELDAMLTEVRQRGDE